jgi:hypothetical protein
MAWLRNITRHDPNFAHATLDDENDVVRPEELIGVFSTVEAATFSIITRRKLGEIGKSERRLTSRGENITNGSVLVSVQLALARQDAREQSLFLGSRPGFSDLSTPNANRNSAARPALLFSRNPKVRSADFSARCLRRVHRDNAAEGRLVAAGRGPEHGIVGGGLRETPI